MYEVTELRRVYEIVETGDDSGTDAVELRSVFEVIESPLVIPGPGLVDRVRVSSNDASSGYLLDKLEEGVGVALEEQNDAANETVRISATGGIPAVAYVADTNQALSGLAAVDGVALSDGDRVLAVAQSTASENGIWEAHAGAWTRPADWGDAFVASGKLVTVGADGTRYPSTLWIVETADPIVVDTTAVSLVRLSLPETQRVLTFGVENPISGDDIPRLWVPRAFLVEEIRALRIGGTGSFDWELRYDADAGNTGGGTLLESDTGVTNDSAGEQYLPPFDPGAPTIIPAGNFIWLELANVSTGLSRPVMVTLFVLGRELG